MQANDKDSVKQPVPSKEGVSFKGGFQEDSHSDTSVAATPFSDLIPKSTGSQKGKLDFKEKINETVILIRS